MIIHLINDSGNIATLFPVQFTLPLDLSLKRSFRAAADFPPH